MAKNEQKNVSNVVMALSDLFTLPVTLAPVVIAWAGPVFLIRWGWSDPIHLAVAVIASPLVAALGLIVGVRGVRLFLPPLTKGLFPFGWNRGFLAWCFHMALSRSGDISGLKLLIQSSAVLKFLYWRAQGAKIAFGINSSMTLAMVDYPMIQVGAGSTLADGVFMTAHTFVGDKILLAPIVIGKNVFVGYNCFLSARTRIGDNVRIGIHNKFGGDVIPAGTVIENFAWEHGSPERKFSRTQKRLREEVSQ